jgi:hypothetical protein
MKLKLVISPCRLYCKEAAGFLVLSSCFRDDPFFALGKEKATLEVDFEHARGREGERKRTCLTTSMRQVETVCCNNAN